MLQLLLLSVHRRELPAHIQQIKDQRDTHAKHMHETAKALMHPTVRNTEPKIQNSTRLPVSLHGQSAGS